MMQIGDGRIIRCSAPKMLPGERTSQEIEMGQKRARREPIRDAVVFTALALLGNYYVAADDFILVALTD
jgi:hypothetical protein